VDSGLWIEKERQKMESPAISNSHEQNMVLPTFWAGWGSDWVFFSKTRRRARQEKELPKFQFMLKMVLINLHGGWSRHV